MVGMNITSNDMAGQPESHSHLLSLSPSVSIYRDGPRAVAEYSIDGFEPFTVSNLDVFSKNGRVARVLFERLDEFGMPDGAIA